MIFFSIQYLYFVFFQKQLQEAEYGSDLPSVQNELDIHQREHKNIEQFHTRVEHCVSAKVNINPIFIVSVLHNLFPPQY